MISCNVEYRLAGEAPSTETQLFLTAWTEFIELQVMEQKAWEAQSLRFVTERARFDLVVFDDAKPIGGAVLTVDEDVHVGLCMQIMFNYVLPEYRTAKVGSAIFRESLALTRRLGLSIISYTHRVGDWQYVTKYRKVHGTEKPEQDT